MLFLKLLNFYIKKKKFYIKKKLKNYNFLNGYRPCGVSAVGNNIILKRSNKTSTNFFFFKLKQKKNFFCFFLKKKQNGNLIASNTLFIYNNNLVGFELCYFVIIFKNYYLFIPFIYSNFSKPFFCKHSNIFFFKWDFFVLLNFGLLQIFKRWVKRLLKSIYKFSFGKIKYKGKNYRWNRKCGGLVLRFGHSHLVWEPRSSLIFQKKPKKKKFKLLFWGTNKFLLKTYFSKIWKWYPMIFFTMRGIFLAKQFKLKKLGKLSAYIF